MPGASAARANAAAKTVPGRNSRNTRTPTKSQRQNANSEKAVQKKDKKSTPVGDDKRKTQIPLKNQFDPLATLDEESNNAGQEDPPDLSAKDSEQAVKVKVPPIVVYATSTTTHAELMTFLHEKCTATVNVIYSPNKITILPKNRADYEKVLSDLTEAGTPYHTYTPTWNKVKQLVLKGLAGVTEDEISAALGDLGFVCDKINAIKKKDAPMPNRPVFLVTFTPDVDLNKVRETRYIMYVRVWWEPYKNKRGVTQCHNCQGFGHGTKNCGLPSKCVKCAGNHHTTKCTKLKTAPAKGANCEGNHPANFSGCKSIASHKEKLANTRSKTSRQRAPPAMSRANYPAMKRAPEQPGFHPQEPQEHHNYRETTYAAHLGQAPTQPHINDREVSDLHDFFAIMSEVNKLKQHCNLEKVLKTLTTLNEKLAHSAHQKMRKFYSSPMNSQNKLTNLNIAHWNANGLKHKIKELAHFLNEHDIHVISLCETKLTPNNRIYIPGYNHVRCDRANAAHPAGGVMLLIRDGISYTQVSISTPIMETVGIDVETSLGTTPLNY